MPLARFFGASGGMRRGVVVLSSGNAAGQLIVLAATPILTRLYDPADLGQLAVFASILSSLSVVASLRLELAIPLPERADEATGVARLALYALAIVSSVVLVICVVGLAATALPQEWDQLVVLFPVAFLTAGLVQVLTLWGTRAQAFGWLSTSRVVKSSLQAGTQLMFGAVSASPTSLVGGLLVGQGAAAISLGTGTRLGRALRAHAANRSLLRSLLRRYSRFPKVSTWSALVNSLGLYVVPVVIAVLYDATTAGWFALSQRIVGNPLAIVRDGATFVFFGEAPRRYRRGANELLDLNRLFARKLLLIGFPIVLVLAALGPAIFGVVFGEEWAEAGQYVALLAPMYLAQFVVVPITQTLAVLQRQALQLAWDVVRLVVVVASLAIPWAFGLGSYAAVLSLSLASSLMYLLMYVIIRRALQAEIFTASEGTR